MGEHPTDFELGLIRGVAQATRPGSTRFIKLNRALSQAARVLGCWSEPLEEWLVDESREWTDDVIRFYDACVQVIRAGVFVEGQGNYGDAGWLDGAAPIADDCPPCAPSHPKFLDCRLTARGREVLA